MSPTLMDTNTLLRGADTLHPQHVESLAAEAVLRSRGHRPCIVSQVLVEFRAVATRPRTVNGLGMNQTEADAAIKRISKLFPVFDDVPSILGEWRYLVSTYGSIGKQNHDARIVAAMLTHGIPTLLTYNKSDFIRYSMITVLTPSEVLAL